MKTANKKRKLPFNPKKLDQGSGKLYQKMEDMRIEWNSSSTKPTRKREIERAYKACLKQWNRIHDEMAKYGIHIGTLG